MKNLHAWDLTPSAAVALQKQLAHQVDLTTPLELNTLKLVGGVDVSVKNNISRAAIVVLTYPELEVVEAVTAKIPTPFPYISGLLTFREGQVILAAHAKLQQKPDVYIFDGMGVMHPRRLGVAAHLGLWLDAPTVGCGKTRLLGETLGELGQQQGSSQAMFHKDEHIGYLVRTRTDVKPVYISAGHRATHESARELILRTTTKYRLPEPIRAAHNTAGGF